MSKNKRMKWSWVNTSLSQRETTKGRVHHASHLKCRGGWRKGQQIILEKHRGASSWGFWAVTQILVVTSSVLKKQWRKMEWGTLIRIGFLKDNWCFTDRGWIGRWHKIDPQWPLPWACRNPAWWRSWGYGRGSEARSAKIWGACQRWLTGSHRSDKKENKIEDDPKLPGLGTKTEGMSFQAIGDTEAFKTDGSLGSPYGSRAWAQHWTCWIEMSLGGRVKQPQGSRVQSRGVQSAERSWGCNFETGESTMKIWAWVKLRIEKGQSEEGRQSGAESWWG